MSRVLQKTLVQCLHRSRIPCHVAACPSIGYQNERFLWNRKFEWNEDMLFKVWDRYDISLLGLQTFLNQREKRLLKADQAYREERYKYLGAELAAATFVLARGGRIKFTHDEIWYRQSSSGQLPIPNKPTAGFYIEGIDASNMPLMLVGFDNIRDLPHLRYMKLSNMEHLTDWYLARLTRYRETLEFLDVSGCGRITDAGLAALHSLRNLKVLNISKCTNINNAEVVSTFLHELIPDLTIIGLDTIPKLEGDFVSNEILTSRYLCSVYKKELELNSGNDAGDGNESKLESDQERDADGQILKLGIDEVNSRVGERGQEERSGAKGEYIVHNREKSDGDHFDSDRKEFVNR